jgi:hypothetical protein
MTDVLVIDKNGSIKETNVKNYIEKELFKKCGFKKSDGFNKEGEWSIKIDKQSYNILLYGKTTGRANYENKYDFPPPLDNTLFFGSCLLICFKKNELVPCDLTTELWDKIYEKLFGGFEDLASTQEEDDNEIDELENIPKKFKTKSGYLKDDFVVSDSEESGEKEEGLTELSCSSNFNEDESSGLTSEDKLFEEMVLEDFETELEEEEYESSSEDEMFDA